MVLILYLDRLEPEPRALLAAMFGAGAGIAVITLLLGRAFGTGAITPPELGPHAGSWSASRVGAAIGGALVAQTLNGVVLLALLASRRTEIDGAHDGVVYASMTGLGFALVANLYAYSEAWNAGASALVEEFARRGVFGPLFQALFTSMIGLGVAYAASRRSRRVPGDRGRLGRRRRARRALEPLRDRTAGPACWSPTSSSPRR